MTSLSRASLGHYRIQSSNRGAVFGSSHCSCRAKRQHLACYSGTTVVSFKKPIWTSSGEGGGGIYDPPPQIFFLIFPPCDTLSCVWTNHTHPPISNSISSVFSHPLTSLRSLQPYVLFCSLSSQASIDVASLCSLCFLQSIVAVESTFLNMPFKFHLFMLHVLFYHFFFISILGIFKVLSICTYKIYFVYLIPIIFL